MRYKDLPEDYALVLQQISEDGGDHIDDLAELVRMDRSRLLHIVSSLQHKGLINIEQLGYGAWLNLNTKGRRFMQYLWPESAVRFKS